MEKRNFWNWNIFKKLMTMSMLLVIIPVLIISVAGVANFSSSIQDETIKSMESIASNKLDLLQNATDHLKTEAYATAYHDKVISFLTYLNNNNEKQAANVKGKAVSYLKSAYDQGKGMYENLFYADSKGITVADATGGTAEGKDMSQRDYFISASKSKDVVISDVLKSAMTNKAVMVVAVPLYDKDNFIGMMGIVVDFQKFTKSLVSRTKGLKYNYTVFNSEGLVIAHEQQERVLKASMTHESESQKALFDKMVSNQASYGYYDLKGTEKIMAYTPFLEKHWYVTVSCTVNDYMNSVNSFIFMIIVIALLCMIVAAIAAFIFSRSISKPLKQLSFVSETIAIGDLTKNVDIIKSGDEIGKLSNDFSNMQDNLRTLIKDVRDMSSDAAASAEEMMASSEEVSKVSEQIAAAVNDLAEGATNQAQATEKGNKKIMQVVSGLNEIASDMSKSEDLTGKAIDAVEEGKKSVELQSSKMKENRQVSSEVSTAIIDLSHKSSEIEGILEVIKGISEQTNLLALNAAIEAARAGETGRGFAVVADEIRTLAEQSSNSVKEIDKIINQVQTGVDITVEKMKKAGNMVEEQEKALDNTVNAFESIEAVVHDINSSIKKVAGLSKSLDLMSNEAGKAINDISVISEDTASGTEEVAASTEEQTSVIQQIADASTSLAQLASKLQESINKFKI